MVRINTKYGHNDIPVIKIRFSGVDDEYYAMIDSGSAITMFNELLIDDIKHDVDTDCNISITGINGERTSDSSWITALCSSTDVNGEEVYFKFDGVTFDMKEINGYYNENYNIDTVFAMIIGSDVLSKLKAKINYEENTLDIDEKEGADE